jgi:hypothetical protein
VPTIVSLELLSWAKSAKVKISISMIVVVRLFAIAR